MKLNAVTMVVTISIELERMLLHFPAVLRHFYLYAARVFTFLPLRVHCGRRVIIDRSVGHSRIGIVGVGIQFRIDSGVRTGRRGFPVNVVPRDLGRRACDP